MTTQRPRGFIRRLTSLVRGLFAGWVRDRALESMRAFGQDLLEPTIELLSDPDEEVRLFAAVMLGSLKEATAAADSASVTLTAADAMSDPNDPSGNTIYVTTGRGVHGISSTTAGAVSQIPTNNGVGVWKSTDGGAFWQAKTETLGTLSIGTVTMAIEHGLMTPREEGTVALDVPAGRVVAQFKRDGRFDTVPAAEYIVDFARMAVDERVIDASISVSAPVGVSPVPRTTTSWGEAASLVVNVKLATWAPLVVGVK